MTISKSIICVALLLLLSSLRLECSTVQKKAYIVYFGSHSHGRDAAPEVYDAVENSHYEFLSKYLGSYEKAKEAIFYSYQKHINGFAAILTDDEAAEIKKHPDVVSVFLNKMNQIQTTNSWNFMGLEHKSGAVPHNSLWRKANYGEDVIIGHLDTGVWPESKSFSDEGYGPVPSRWRGVCQPGQNDTNSLVFSCNKKLIGARYFGKGFPAEWVPWITMNPRDHEGHGTHTLSTSGGNFVSGVDFLGLAHGTAKGGAPRARLAAYKVCWGDFIGCTDADIIAAFDTAINDGVDVISISLGPQVAGPATPYFHGSIPIGSFHAMKHGVMVVASAGNSGPNNKTLGNMAPWLLSVAASTQNREIRNFVKLRTDKEGVYKWFKGESFSEPFPDNGTLYPIITGDQAATNLSSLESTMCSRGSLNPEMVKGKIVVCMDGAADGGQYVADIGAAGLISYNPKKYADQLFPKPYLLPAITISYDQGLQLLHLMNTTNVTLGSITVPSAKYNVRPAPVMARFSSRGPNINSPTVLKPDITAPGVDILAAYSEGSRLTESQSDHRRESHILMSGTSMSAPHVSGILALLKAIHPDWSPAAIRSAIMTTATTIDNRRKPMLDYNGEEATPFNYGAGHVNPNRADEPGLVYDLSLNDYLLFLCAENYTTEQLKTYFLDQEGDQEFKCPNSTGLVDLNYPAIIVPSLNKTVTLPRRVKNVGSPGIYRVLVRAPTGVSVTVKPTVLSFEGIGEEKEFTVTISDIRSNVEELVTDEYSFGEMVWSDGKHFVKSPIGVAFS